MPSVGGPWPWLALAGLGAFHGGNPGMGWLFAVALGMQEGRGRAVWRSLVPLGLGHAVAVAAALAIAWALEIVVPLAALKWPIAASLVGIGLYRLVRQRHPRYGGMRVGSVQLAVWSFLMASAHGAGLMVVPVFLGMTGGAAEGPHADHLPAAAAPSMMQEPLLALLATAVHGAAYLLVTALVAWIVYTRLGVLFLRRAWLNLDLVWAGALILTGLLTALL